MDGQCQNLNSNQASTNEENKEEKIAQIKSKNKTGIVHLSRIPPGRNYTRIREICEKFAPVGNIYLIPDKIANERLKKKNRSHRYYLEGYVEFKRKKDAKNFAEIYNGASLSKNKFDHFTWDIRYLHRVKWNHIMAKFKHAKALEQQKLRLETEKAREIADHYLDMLNKWKRNKGNPELDNIDVTKQEQFLSKSQRKSKAEILNAKKLNDQKDLNDLYETLFHQT